MDEVPLFDRGVGGFFGCDEGKFQNVGGNDLELVKANGREEEGV